MQLSMSHKRSRRVFESDQAVVAFYGTPVADQPEADNGSFVPIWKQEVKDEKGRRRLHGAFTGGWSAGYFNTVGSKDGWTPSTFISSQKDRRKNDPTPAVQRPEDYMDDEDLADAAASEKLRVSDSFRGLGTIPGSEGTEIVSLNDLFRTHGAQGETVGFKLLRKMGWKPGQGIGPRVRRQARLDEKGTKYSDDRYLFAPEDAGAVDIPDLTGSHGLGFQRQGKLRSLETVDTPHPPITRDPDVSALGTTTDHSSPLAKFPPQTLSRRGGFGVGVLNDTGSDDEDLYDSGPRLTLNRVQNSRKSSKKKALQQPSAVGPTLAGSTQPGPALPLVFLSRSMRSAGSVANGSHGPLFLPGFVPARDSDTNYVDLTHTYDILVIPAGWRSSKTNAPEHTSTSATTITSAIPQSSKARAAILGEKPLPGKSVFDYLSSSARDRLAVATGRVDLPQARNECKTVPSDAMDTTSTALPQLPQIDHETALAALARSGSGLNGPYADNEAKRERYLAYLRSFINSTGTPFLHHQATVDEKTRREWQEFKNCAMIFKPMAGPMASRFTPASTTVLGSATSQDARDMPPSLASAAVSSDPSEEAARLGMYGKLTRTVTSFVPARLVCKRLEIPMPLLAGTDDVVVPEQDKSHGAQKRPFDGQLMSFVDAGGQAFHTIFGDPDDPF